MMNKVNPPKELRVKNKGSMLEVTFDDNTVYELSAELLRVESPSAEVQGHSPDEKKTISGKQDAKIIDVEMIGNYAVKLVFADGHDTGLYTWQFLAMLGENQAAIWGDYLDRLKELGLSREH